LWIKKGLAFSPAERYFSPAERYFSPAMGRKWVEKGRNTFLSGKMAETGEKWQKLWRNFQM